MLSFALEVAFSKQSQVTAFQWHYRYSNVFKFCFNAIIALKHDFLIHLHQLGPSEDVETRARKARVSTPHFGAKQMLMLRKPCLIPILMHYEHFRMYRNAQYQFFLRNYLTASLCNVAMPSIHCF